jgi:RNA polymerase sigma factor (sigma-70 family)
MSGFTDEQLAVTFQSALRQADGAFWQLHERHAPRLLAFLRTRSGPRADAEDVHQEVWLRVWRNLPTRFRGDNFRAWLYEIARNCGIDVARKSNRERQTVPFDDAQPLPAEWSQPPAGQISEEQERREERKNALRRGLRELEGRDPDAAAVVRARMAGRGYEEICQELHLKPNEAHKLFHKAKEHLRGCAERVAP